MAVAIPQVESGCYFFSLKTGAKIVGLLSILGCLLVVFSALVYDSSLHHDDDSKAISIVSSFDDDKASQISFLSTVEPPESDETDQASESPGAHTMSDEDDDDNEKASEAPDTDTDTDDEVPPSKDTAPTDEDDNDDGQDDDDDDNDEPLSKHSDSDNDNEDNNDDDDPTSSTTDDDEDDHQIIEITVHIVHLAASVSLLWGAFHEKRKLLIPYLVTVCFMAVLELVFQLPAVIRRFYEDASGEHNSTFEDIVCSLLMLVDDVYGWIIVYSFYRFLGDTASDMELRTV